MKSTSNSMAAILEKMSPSWRWCSSFSADTVFSYRKPHTLFYLCHVKEETSHTFTSRVEISVVDPDPQESESFCNLDLHPDPHPHKMKIRICIKIYKLDTEPDPEPHQFSDVKPKCTIWNMSLLYFSTFSRVWAFLKLGSGSASRWCGSTTLEEIMIL